MIAETEIIVKRNLRLVFSDDGNPIKIESFSPLSELTDKLGLTIVLEREAGKSVYAFRRVCREGSKDHDFILLHRDSGLAGMTKREFEVAIPLKVNAGKVFTLYPENSVNLLALSREECRARMYQYSVVGRWGGLFLTKQMLFDGEIGDGGIFFPTTPWVDMNPWKRIWEEEVIKRRFRDWGWSLSHKDCGGRKFSPVFPAKQTAFVLWFNAAMGYGYGLLADRSVARIHWQHLPKGRIYLGAGRFVSYRKTELHYSGGYNKNAVLQLAGVTLL